MKWREILALILAILLILLIVFVLAGWKKNSRHLTQDGHWQFEGTFCAKCNFLYNYERYPNICDKCGETTKDFYYLALIINREDKK